MRPEIHDTYGLHEGNDGLERILRITSACTQRCAFCFVDLTGRGADMAEIERALDSLAGSAPARAELTFSGGEPTADPRLPQILESARRRGYRRFALQTNAVLLARPGLVERLIGLGVRAYMVSFHSHRTESYDKITGSRRQRPLAVAGLSRLIRSRRCDVSVNIVVNEWNYRDLPGLVRFLGRLSSDLARRRKPSIIFSMINEAGHDRAPTLAVDLARVAPFLREAIELCRREGLSVCRFSGESSLPVCLLSRPARYASRRTFPQDRVRYAEDFSGGIGACGRAKRPGCRECPYDARCLGVPALYARRFGLGALGLDAPPKKARSL